MAVGASLGGVAALERLLREMPKDAPPMLIVQHMPAGVTARFAARCDALCALSVKEARDGDAVLRGRALLAPGGLHLRLARDPRRGGLYVTLDEGPRENGHRPSVDVLFGSVAANAGGGAVGILLTGMGRDGARGLLQMKEAGARTIVQDEATCVVFGMPQAAIELRAADWVLPLHEIAARALRASEGPGGAEAKP